MEFLLKTNINKDDNILVFSEYCSNFKKLNDIFIKFNGENLVLLKGSTYVIDKIIKNYRNKKIHSLYLNASYNGSGLNLENTDIVIMMHKMSQDLENQIIGRAQRIGRIKQLKVFRLITSNEK